MRKHVRTYNVAKKFHHTLYIRKVSKKASEHTIRYFLCIQYIILNGLYRTVLLVRTEYFDHTCTYNAIVHNAKFTKFSALNLSHACSGFLYLHAYKCFSVPEKYKYVLALTLYMD